jgi:uncharacterized protein (DUF885 family)
MGGSSVSAFIARIAAYCAALTLCISGAFAETPASAALERLARDHWAAELRAAPFWATMLGVHEYDAQTPSISPDDFAARVKEAKEQMVRLDTIDRTVLTEDERVTAAILEYKLKQDIAFERFKDWRIPLTADSGFHTEMNLVVAATRFEMKQDYENYLGRLEKLPAWIDQNIANMRLGLEEGYALPKAILPGVLPGFDAQALGDVEAHKLYQPFVAARGLTKKDAAALRKRAKATLANAVIPAYARAAKFMREEYLPKAPDAIGISARKDGAEEYAALIGYFTSRNDLDAEEIHTLGLKEVARIRGEMDAVIKLTGFKGDFKAFLEFLRTDPQFYLKSAEELLMRAAWLSKELDGKLPAFFGTLPRQPYTVSPVPDDIAPNYTTGRYVDASPDSGRAGQYWVNTYALDQRPYYDLPALTAHEAVPGHHLQSALAYEIVGAPEFREQFYQNAFGEGWALYAEKLAKEMGLYKTPYEEFGRLSMEMWRAARLVVDTGIHAKGWTRDEAMDFMASNTAMSLKNVQTETDRYISWPGQALSYKIGELTILELRSRAEAKLGAKFDIRKFHDVVLTSGTMPLGELEARVDRWIAAERE